MDPGRQEALADIKVLAYRLSGNWSIVISWAERDRRWKIPWPPDQAGREVTWERVEAILLRAPKDGEVRLVPARAPKDRVLVLPWPPPHDLFTGTEAPPKVEPKQETTAADGERVRTPADLPQLTIREGTTDGSEEVLNIVVIPTEEVKKRRRSSPKCAEHVLALLDEADQRMTRGVMANALSARRLPWDDCTLGNTLAELVREGKLTNDRDERGIGYGLPRWTQGDIEG